MELEGQQNLAVAFIFGYTPLKFNSSSLKNDAWKMNFLLGPGNFLGAIPVKLQGGGTPKPSKRVFFIDKIPGEQNNDRKMLVIFTQISPRCKFIGIFFPCIFFGNSWLVKRIQGPHGEKLYNPICI